MFTVSRAQKFIGIMCLSILLMVGAIYAAILITHSQTAQVGNGRARCQAKEQITRTIVIKDARLTPEHTYATICDKLRLINEDSTARLMAFGKHESHISYDGVSERLLQPGQSLTVTLVKDGTFIIHDHADEQVSGLFTVNGSLR